MDVEEHIPVMEQKIVSLVRRSWGIDGRSDLLDMIRYLRRKLYLRYQLYSEASSPEELMDETMDEDDRESTSRAWRFAQQYKSQYSPGFMAGWDIGRAAMLTRWGCYLGLGLPRVKQEASFGTYLSKRSWKNYIAGANLLSLTFLAG